MRSPLIEERPGFAMQQTNKDSKSRIWVNQGMAKLSLNQQYDLTERNLEPVIHRLNSLWIGKYDTLNFEFNIR